MLETQIYPDFIVVDGTDGGTGAAPLEFTDNVGMPLREGLNFVHNALIDINARDRREHGLPRLALDLGIRSTRFGQKFRKYAPGQGITVSTGKGECIAKRFTDFWIEFTLQSAPRA
jgi:hypothetical protein